MTTNPDGTTKEASYGGCGCAGGAVVTLLDEGTLDGGVPKRREQKLYSDVLGRTVKTEVLNWQGGSVYSATVNTYNARDQITQVRQYAGAEGSGTYQDTTMTYDGYGRLKTRHLPEQNTGTATTWDYNADDTIQKITDARGASQTFSYNARHVPTGITYAAPAGITIPAAVSFAYDAAGNRTSMTDGSGSKSYVYDELSRLQSETRTITGLGSFQLSYLYNLAGQMTSVTDPFGSQVVYAHDPGGRISSVTGTGFPNVSTYASNFQYRASNLLKHLNYGNNRTLDIGYNSRLQPSTYQIPNLINKSYQYYSDGTLKYSQDLLDARFDRSYGFDHAARVTQAFSGAEARGQGPTNDRPYKETMTHDALGHMSNREKKHWSAGTVTTTDSYVNNRHAGWTYDSDGRLLQSQSPYISYEYDAAGRMTHTNSDLVVDITQTFDGDGEILKRHEVDTIYEEGGSSYTVTSDLYLLRSSVLGGKVLTEVGASGQKLRTYVYANGALLAWQQVNYLNGVVTSQLPVWEHRDASNASYRVSSPTTSDPESSAELDPFVSNMGLENPYQFPPPYSHKPNIFYPGFGWGANQACRVDAVDTPCNEAMQVVNNHAGTVELARQGPDGRFPPLDLGKRVEFIGDYLIVGHSNWTKDGNNYYYQGMSFVGIILPQNPLDEPAIKSTVLGALATKACEDFAKTVLGGQKRKGLGTLNDVAKSFFGLAGPRFTRSRPPGSTLGISNPIGRISTRTAQIYSLGNDATLTSSQQTLNDADSAISELFHLAAQGNHYTDEELATAVHNSSYAADAYALMSNGKPLIDPRSNIFDPRYIPDKKDKHDRAHSFSRYFHTIQQKYCTSMPGQQRGVGFQP